ncbi:HEAT and SNF2-related and DNA RNA helicase domain containing protein [Aphelenchoides besseyi]|nr:HEAT and SNF2-related and DNA RNA helicase domain containing protein [Aphelenchoides besseyi]
MTKKLVQTLCEDKSQPKESTPTVHQNPRRLASTSQMSDSRINRLSQLLESPNRVLRNEAAAQLAKFPLFNSALRETLRKQLQSTQWDTRTAAAQTFGLLLERTVRELSASTMPTNFNVYEPETLIDLDLSDVITHYKVLLSCEERVMSKTKALEKRLSSREQRRLVDQHLDFAVQAGVSSRSFLKDEDLGGEANGQNDEQSSGSDDVKEQLASQLQSNETSAGADSKIDEEDSESSIRIHLNEFVRQLLVDLASVNWQQRHGTSMALYQVVTYALPLLPPQVVESLAIRTLQVVALDRFNDFVTGSNAVAPVRESAAQTLSMLMLRLGTQTPLIRSVIGHLQVLMLMNEDKNWPCRQTALIVLKYFFAACTTTEEFASLFDYAVEATKDLVDEVVSMAVHAVSSLFENQRISADQKHQLIQVVMKSVWEMLLSTDAEAQQLTDGVSSLLIDLLGVAKTWLCVDKNAHLSVAQFRHIVDLFDPSQLSSTVRAMECACLALSKSSELGDEEIFQLLKMLYRCVLFVQPSDASKLLDLSFATLMKIIEVYPEQRLASIQQLQTTIGYWAGCLAYDHKSSEFDVFTHNVNGPTSSRSQPLEILCGEEARFLDDQQKQTTFMERKCLAARFLSPLIDVLYRSQVQIQDQHLHLSLQLHFIPYLRTNSLHQRLGVVLLLNCWARQFRRAFNAQKQQEYPTFLVREVERVLVDASTSQHPSYDEVNTIIKVLTNECNEFRRYCIAKGVSATVCPVVENAGGMEQVVEKLYTACRSRLQKPNDLEALEGRRKYLLQLIAATRLEIRTNTNRLHALCSSALFYWGHLPAQLTPMIRPLVDSTDTEEIERLAEECFYDSFPIMLAATQQRQPCPHTKILKQLTTGIQQDEKFTPKPADFVSDSTSSTSDQPVIFSVQNTLLQPTEIRARNCQLIVKKLGEQLGRMVFDICPELRNYLQLDAHNMETIEGIESFLCNLEVVRLLAPSTFYRPSAESDVPVLLAQLANPNAAVRFRVSRCLAELAAADFSFVLNNFYEPFVELLNRIDSPAARCGAVEFLSLLTVRLEATQLIVASSLLAPRALSALSDPLPSVRELAAFAFGRLVGLMHLENNPESVLAGLNDQLTKSLAESRHFVNVLSAPHLLPTVNPKSIPNLRDDFELRHYQLEGITWLQFLSTYGLNGILADDMGLGKTIQTLSLLSIEREKQNKLPSLIVCPRTLANHWLNEWSRYFPSQEPFIKFESSLNVNRLKNTKNVLVLSYEELRGNIKRINPLVWNYVVLDEGHCIRNPNTQLFEALESLVTKRKLLLSGTPVQNSPADLWALFRFLMPDYLSTRSNFQSRFLRPILACRNPKASEQQTKEGEEALGQLHRLVLPFVLRRLKSDVLKELPDKVVQDCMCNLTDVQRDLYAAIVAQCSLMEKDEDEANKSVAIKTETVDDKPRLSPLHTLIALRQLVDHPSMIREVLRKIGWSNSRIYDPDAKTATKMQLSGKLIALKELLQECQIGDRNGSDEATTSEPVVSASNANTEFVETMPTLSQHRALIFCQWRASVDLVARYLDDGSLGTGVKYLRLDGTIQANDRQGIVDRFNNDPSIDLLLVTTHIGGVGLTLTGADVVIFLDHDYNPVKDLQAVDRAHRLGQTRTVNVYRLITQGSIEEKIMQFQKFKTDTANALVGADNRSISSMATDELLELFNLSGSTATSQSTDQKDGPTARKRRRKAAATANVDDQWSMEELWDESQYETEHSVRAFMDRT